MSTAPATLRSFWSDARTTQAYLLAVACIAVWIRVATLPHSHPLANLLYIARKLVGLEP